MSTNDSMTWQEHLYLWILMELAYGKANVRSFAEQGRALSRESLVVFVIQNAMSMEDLEQYVLEMPSKSMVS